MKKQKLNFLDMLFILTIFLVLTGYVLARENKTPLNKHIEQKEQIAIEVFIPDVYCTNDKNILFKVGDEAGITIRNRPYTKLPIINVRSKQKLITIPTLQGTFKVIEDPSKKHLIDYFITISDLALKTKDGYIVSGNKIKIGNPIELEGFNYRLTGKIISVHPVKQNLNENI